MKFAAGNGIPGKAAACNPGNLYGIPGIPLPMQLPANDLEKQQMMAKMCGPLPPPGRPRRTSGLMSGSALAVGASWGVNQQMKDLFLPLSLFVFQMNKFLFLMNL